MHNEQSVYAQALNLIDTFAQKHLRSELNEFEYLLYQKLCNAMTVYFGGLQYAFQISAMKTEVECRAEEIKYLALVAQLQQAELEAEKAKDKPFEEPPAAAA